MKRIAQTLRVSKALCAVIWASPVRAEREVAKLKASIETSVETGYPKSG